MDILKYDIAGSMEILRNSVSIVVLMDWFRVYEAVDIVVGPVTCVASCNRAGECQGKREKYLVKDQYWSNMKTFGQLPEYHSSKRLQLLNS